MDFLEEEIEFTPGPVTEYLHEALDPDAVERLAQILRTAASPVIVVGTEVARYGAIAALERLSDLVDASVLGEIKGADLAFPNTNPRYVGKLTASSPALEGADVVVLLGAELTEGLAMPLPDFGDSLVVQVTVDPLALRRQYAGQVGILSHPGRLLDAVADRLAEGGAVPVSSGGRVRGLRERWEAGREALRSRLLGEADGAVSAAHIADLIHRLGGSETIVANQCGSAEGFIDTLVDYGAPWTYFGLSGKASAQGWGAPAAVGIQMARPDRRVIAVLGDGGFMFNSTAIHTAAAYDVPVVYLVLDNGGWRDVATVTGAMGSSLGEPGAEDAMRWTFRPPIDHASYARSLGLKSWRASNPEELESAFAAAFAEDGPTLIQVASAMGDVRVFGQAFA